MRSRQNKRASPTRASVSASLRRLSRHSGTFDASRYFRGDHGLRFYNAGAQQVRALAREIHADVRERWSLTDVVTFADALIRDPYLETKGVAIEVLARYRKLFTPKLLTTFKRWLARNDAANWATTDAMCSTLIGPLLADRPELIPEMRTWARHRNLWVRRASTVALIPPMRRGLARDLVYEIAGILHADEHDLIQKAVGWTLREAGKADGVRLERYLRTRGASIPRTTVRYAIERFPPAQRRELLSATRSS
jgi:3-methyladenine DNA glycosylase AlkD